MTNWVDWQSLGAIVAIGVVAAAIIYRLIHGKLRDEFVLQRDFDELEKVVRSIQKTMGDAPGHSDFRILSDRVGQVEQGQGVVKAMLQGIAEAVKRIEHQSDLMLEDRLKETRT